MEKLWMNNILVPSGTIPALMDLKVLLKDKFWMKEAFNTFWKATDFIFTVNINVVLLILRCLNYSYKLWQAN